MKQLALSHILRHKFNRTTTEGSRPRVTRSVTVSDGTASEVTSSTLGSIARWIQRVIKEGGGCITGPPARRAIVVRGYSTQSVPPENRLRRP